MLGGLLFISAVGGLTAAGIIDGSNRIKQNIYCKKHPYNKEQQKIQSEIMSVNNYRRIAMDDEGNIFQKVLSALQEELYSRKLPIPYSISSWAEAGIVKYHCMKKGIPFNKYQCKGHEQKGFDEAVRITVEILLNNIEGYDLKHLSTDENYTGKLEYEIFKNK